MAKFLLPRRGSKADATTQNVRLYRGEMFMEFPNGNIGNEPGRIVVGNGNNYYSELSYASTTTGEFQPFITDPSIYVPRFDNTRKDPVVDPVSSYSDSLYKLNTMNDYGSTSSTVTLSDTIGNMKEVASLHNNNLRLFNRFIEWDQQSIDSLNNYTTYTFQPTLHNTRTEDSTTYVTRTGKYYESGAYTYIDFRLSGQYNIPIQYIDNNFFYISLPRDSIKPENMNIEVELVKEDSLGYIQGLSIYKVNQDDNVKCDVRRYNNTYNIGFTYNDKDLGPAEVGSTVSFDFRIRGVISY